MKRIFFPLTILLFSGCQHYGSDDIPMGVKDQEKAREVYNAFPDSAKIGSTTLIDTVNNARDQMEPENSTGAVPGSTR